MSKMMVPCRKKSGTISFNEEDEFKDMVRQHTDPMDTIELLIKYLPYAMQQHFVAGNVKEVSNYIFHQKECYHTERYEKKGDYESDFFKSFTYEDFTYSFDDDASLQLFPTERLSIFNEALNEPSMAAIIQNISNISKLHAKVKNGFVRKRKLLTHVDYIRSSFRNNWELQADGDQTNATLQTSSIKRLALELRDKGVVNSNTVFLDCGSSYGSLLWFLSYFSMDHSTNLKLLGIEYSLLRHVLGCHTAYHMLKKAKSKTSRLQGELLPNVILQHGNLEAMSSFVGSPTIVFMFDKAFNWELCFHVLLCAIATPSVMYLISCKGSFKTTGKCGVEIKFNKLVENTELFEVFDTIKGLKMNGKSEAGGTFTVFRRVKGKESFRIENEHIRKWLEGCGDANEKNVLSCWNKALETQEQDLPSLNTYEEFVDYYAHQGCLDKLHKIARNKSDSFKATYPCFEDEQTRCAPGLRCILCAKRFTSDGVKCEVKDSNIHGRGLFAKKEVSEGEILCQYRGETTKSKIQGDYVAQLSNNVYINAEKANTLAKYANHSCMPNAALKKIKVETKVPFEQLWIVATKNIEQESEITIHYGRDFTKFFDEGKCACNVCIKSN